MFYKQNLAPIDANVMHTGECVFSEVRILHKLFPLL